MHSYITALQKWVVLGTMATLVVCNTCAIPPQENLRSQSPSKEKALIARCSPKIVKKRPKIKAETLQVRKGEKPTGFSPLISFQITESGEVINARVKRSSGIHDADSAAMDFIKSGQYNSRPGCPLLDNESSVLIHLSATN